MKTCEYCHELSPDSLKNCTQCGATLPVDKVEMREPFFYEGYMVWPERGWGFVHDELRFHFWLGERLVETVVIHREILRRIIPENTDSFPFIFDLFKLSQGEQEVLRISEQNKDFPATFEIRHIPNPEIESLRGLNHNDLLETLSTRRNYA